ncbi:MAG: hypothetical protein ACRDQA_13660 [Nocardioidaceae bacterium]
MIEHLPHAPFLHLHIDLPRHACILPTHKDAASNQGRFTIQARTRHTENAQLKTAEADAATDEAERYRLEEEARQAQALAEALAEQRDQLEEADRVRGLWYAHTANTRLAAHSAVAALSDRDVDLHPDDTGPTRGWLDAHHEDAAADESAREISDEAELADIDTQREEDAEVFTDRRHESAEAAPDDIRAAAEAAEPVAHADETDWTATAGPDRTKQTVIRAQHALDELQHRRTAEQQRQTEEITRAQQLARWHHDDRQAEGAASRERDRGLEPATPLD